MTVQQGNYTQAVCPPYCTTVTTDLEVASDSCLELLALILC